MKNIGIALALFAGIVTLSSLLSPDQSGSSAEFQTPASFTTAAEQTINGVVSIKSYATPKGYANHGGQQYYDPFFEFFFGPGQGRRQQQPQQPQEQQNGLGSGVILTADGYIVTNNHVIDGAERLEVTLNDNRSFNATVVGADPATDLALIKVEADDLPVIPMGDSESLRVGEWVLAVGNPFGFTSTVTAGIVSAKGRSISSVMRGKQMGIEAFIQTDAAVNPGNSGGALVNTKGELVGINTAIYSNTGNYAGHSFAIPVSIVSKVIDDIRQYGTVQRAVLGIAYGELTSQLAKEKKITAVTDGIYVGEVMDRSAALEGGIQEGDVIIAINGHDVHTSAQMQEQMNKYRPGDKVRITYIRDNKKHETDVTFRNDEGNTAIKRAGTVNDLGATFQTLEGDAARQLGLSAGVKVAELRDGHLRTAGIKQGFVIVEINNMRVKSADDIEKIYKYIMSSNEHDKVMFIAGLYPTGKKAYYAVDLTN